VTIKYVVRTIAIKVKCSQDGGTNLNIDCPNAVKGIVTVTNAAHPVNNNTKKEGLFDRKKNN
jgi:hypothetical protein